MFFKGSFVVLLVAIVVLTLIALPGDGGSATPADVEAKALALIGEGRVQPARLDSGRWEVDVERPDGSLVQVDFDLDMRLLGFDEELGRGGSPARDDVWGPAREKAIQAAFEEVGPGRVINVERDPAEIEVKLEIGRRLIEVEMDLNYRPTEVEEEDPEDE